MGHSDGPKPTVIPAKAGTQALNARALRERFQTSPSFQPSLEDEKSLMA